MAWICVDKDDTLTRKMMDPMTGEMVQEQEEPIEGAVETMMQLAQQGHRLTVFTAEFAPMPESEKQRLKEQIEQDLIGMGFPPMEVWTGTTKPDADIFIDDKAVTFDGDWNLALAQLQYMLEEKGLSMPMMEAGVPVQGEEETPPEETQEGEPNV